MFAREFLLWERIWMVETLRKKIIRSYSY